MTRYESAEKANGRYVLTPDDAARVRCCVCDQYTPIHFSYLAEPQKENIVKCRPCLEKHQEERFAALDRAKAEANK